MPEVHVEVGHYLAHRLGSDDLEGRWERKVETQSAKTVRDLLSQVAQEEPGFSEAIYGGERLRPDVLILINGKLRSWQDAAHVEMKDGDRLSFLPIVEGG
jgi:molybdopterin converting factor small subunit